MVGILFGAIAQGKRVMVKSGDDYFERLIDALLQKIGSGEDKKSYVHDQYSFNYIATGEGYTFIAVCDEDFNSRATFAFLETMKAKFKPSQEEARIVAEMEKQMTPFLFIASGKLASMEQFVKALFSDVRPKAFVFQKPIFERYSSPEKVDRIESIKKELDGVKEVMKENIEKVLERGVVLESLEAKTEQLDMDASAFRGRASSLYRSMWWKDMRFKIAIGVIILIVILVIVLGACGITFHNCGNASPEPQPQPEPVPQPQPTPQPQPASTS